MVCKIIAFIIVTFLISLTYCSGGNETLEKENSNAESNKKIGIHTSAVTTIGSNPGSSSQTSVLSTGAQAGILSRDGSYQPIYNHATQDGGTFQRGSNAPDTWGVATSEIQPGRVGGASYGGANNAQQKNVYTINVNSGSFKELPGGAHLWHGFKLKPKNETTEQTDNNTNTTTAAGTEKKE